MYENFPSPENEITLLAVVVVSVLFIALFKSLLNELEEWASALLENFRNKKQLAPQQVKVQNQQRSNNKK